LLKTTCISNAFSILIFVLCPIFINTNDSITSHQHQQKQQQQHDSFPPTAYIYTSPSICQHTNTGLSSLSKERLDVGFLPTKAPATALAGEEDPPPFDHCCTSRHNNNSPDYSKPNELFGSLAMRGHNDANVWEDTTDLLLNDEEVMEQLDMFMLLGTTTPPLSPMMDLEPTDDFVLFP
jgi:hypothetical protein